MAEGMILDRLPNDDWQASAVDALLRGAVASERRAQIDRGAGVLRDADTLAASAEHLFCTALASRGHLAVVIFDLGSIATVRRRYGLGAAATIQSHLAHLVGMNIQPGVDLAGMLSPIELVLLLPEADLNWATGFAARLAGTLANCPFNVEGDLTALSAPFGVSEISDGDMTFADVVQRARLAIPRRQDA